MMNYKEILQDLYEGHEENYDTKLGFIGGVVFDFTTYEEEYDRILAEEMLTTCEHILNGTTYEYIKEPANRLSFYTMVNMPFLQNKIEWGTSIRGAWFDDDQYSGDNFYISGERLTAKKNLKIFIKDLIEWSKDEQ